jgi:peptidoglycan/xylan/chitin deacetylase (PgdA/CDA1 family)
MKLVPAKTPELVKTIFPNFVWNISTEEKALYLTFDDGPTPEVTEWVLKQLKQYNAKATFFCIGKNIDKHPTIFEDVLKDGHTIGNHTYNHLKGWKTNTKNYLKDIDKAQDVIDSLVKNQKDETHNLFRPPYGKFKSKQSSAIQKLNYKIILWDVLSYDWDTTVSEEGCLSNVMSSAKKGSVIVFHDSIKAKRNLMYALPRVLKYYSEKEYTFKAIT